MCFALNLYRSQHIYPAILCGCRLYLFISLTALLSLGHRRPGALVPKTDPLRFLSSLSPFVQLKVLPLGFLPAPSER